MYVRNTLLTALLLTAGFAYGQPSDHDRWVASVVRERLHTAAEASVKDIDLKVEKRGHEMEAAKPPAPRLLIRTRAYLYSAKVCPTKAELCQEKDYVEVLVSENYRDRKFQSVNVFVNSTGLELF